MTPAVQSLCALSQTQTNPSILNGFFPPKPPNSNQNLSHKIKISRRDFASLSFIALSPVAPASAFSFGICTHHRHSYYLMHSSISVSSLLLSKFETLTHWLVRSRTERLVKRAKEEGLQIRLGTNWRFARNPSLCLSLTQYDSLGFFGVKFLFSRFNLVRFWTAAKDSEYTNKDLEEIQVLVRSAARDCVPQERNSIVSFQASTGVEVWFHGLIFFFVSQF